MTFARGLVTAQPLATLDLRAAHLGGAPVLGALKFSIAAGETVALRGPSGVGKTTLLRILAGLEDTFDGTLTVTSKTAIMFQEPTLLPWRSALDNIRIATGCAPDVALGLLVDVGLGERAGALPAQLSLGQQRRLALARALAKEPELLLLDEPFVSLDADLVTEMQALIIRLCLRHDRALVIVTHSDSEAEALATRVVTLGGTPAQIVSDQR
ncbi:MAG: ATP-binding cassette domain-containing protein [Pseudomonadota bacterium]